jgi:hypothetical protein
MKKHKEGKKNRKWGRQARRPAKARYNAERRWEVNKAKRIAKQKKKEAKHGSQMQVRLQTQECSLL